LKAILEFQLPEEGEEFRIVQEGPSYRGCLQAYSEWLRTQIKHAEMDDTTRATYAHIRAELCRLADQWEVEL
jgi:hypothetical protein